MLSFILVSITIFGFPTVVNASDNMNPSEETVCDGLQGKMFGTCNAYCEAMDCDIPNQQGNGKACQSLLKKWANISGGNPLPCETNPKLTIVKKINDTNYTEVDVGATVQYKFEITNAGNVDLVNVVVDDAVLGGDVDECITVFNSLTLGTTQSKVCIANSIALEGLQTNIASVTATDIYGNTISAQSNEVSYLGFAEEIDLCEEVMQPTCEQASEVGYAKGVAMMHSACSVVGSALTLDEAWVEQATLWATTTGCGYFYDAYATCDNGEEVDGQVFYDPEALDCNDYLFTDRPWNCQDDGTVVNGIVNWTGDRVIDQNEVNQCVSSPE
jgi:uncharacterized repeat protein (TIGR01451 family)